MTRKEAFDFICSLLSCDGSSTAAQAFLDGDAAKCGWEVLIELSNESLVAPAVGIMLAKKGLHDRIPKPIADYFDAMSLLNRQRNSSIREEAQFVSNVLNQTGVTPIFLKGVANLLSGLYPDPAYRYMLDIDILVPKNSLATCVEALYREGYRALSFNDPSGHHYAPLARPGAAASIELHIEPLDTAYSSFLPSAEVAACAIPVEMSGPLARVPAAWCQIVQSIIHAQLSDHALAFGVIPLRELLDVMLLASKLDGADEWSIILRRFAGIGNLPCGYHILAARELLGAKIDYVIPLRRSTAVLYQRAIWQISHPRLAKIVRRILRPCLLLVRSLSQPQLRRRLLQSLMDPTWYRRQWTMLRQDPF